MVLLPSAISPRTQNSNTLTEIRLKYKFITPISIGLGGSHIILVITICPTPILSKDCVILLKAAGGFVIYRSNTLL